VRQSWNEPEHRRARNTFFGVSLVAHPPGILAVTATTLLSCVQNGSRGLLEKHEQYHAGKDRGRRAVVRKSAIIKAFLIQPLSQRVI
jgi:hypothetical protein